MTDQQTHTDAWDMDLILHRHYAIPDHMVITTGTDADDHTKRYSTAVPTARLLAMIDTIDPDAMRAYLRETLMHEDRENLRAYLEPEQLDAIPEADSPEDVDEHPDRDDPTERAQLDRAWALERAVKLFSAGIGSQRALVVAEWILSGSARELETR